MLFAGKLWVKCQARASSQTSLRIRELCAEQHRPRQRLLRFNDSFGLTNTWIEASGKTVISCSFSKQNLILCLTRQWSCLNTLKCHQSCSTGRNINMRVCVCVCVQQDTIKMHRGDQPWLQTCTTSRCAYTVYPTYFHAGRQGLYNAEEI
jgi:hypothetical protein